MDWEKIGAILTANSETEPRNEEDTRFRVVGPILLELGYTHFDILGNSHDGNGNIPDYTVLSEDSACWYLEAKAWNKPLIADHARQATTYAYQNGRRWVVLTNGKQWQLYDSRIPGQSSDRVVLSWDFQAQDLPVDPPAIFRSISKDAMCNGRTERYALQCRLKAVIDDELSRPGSDLITAIFKTLCKRNDLSGITKEMVVEALGDKETVVEAAGDREPDYTGSGEFMHTSLKGTVEGRPVGSWRDLVSETIRAAFLAGETDSAVFKRAGVNICRKLRSDGGFRPVPDTPFSIQGLDADKSWSAAHEIAEISGAEIDVTVTWRDTDKVNPDLRGKRRRLCFPESAGDTPQT